MAALHGLTRLSMDGNVAWDWPAWVPEILRMVVDSARGADAIALRADEILEQCPAAQEMAALSHEDLVERLCGVVASSKERDDLARVAARKGLLLAAISRTVCTSAGIDAGLRHIQVDFSETCKRDACLEALLVAPPSSRRRVEEIVAAHPNEVLSAILLRLGKDQDPRLTPLMSNALGGDGRPLASLARGDLTGLSLDSALDLVELPMNPKKAAVLRYIRSNVDGASADVAAVLLDVAEAATATSSELTTGMLELRAQQCDLLERAVLRMDLGEPERADAVVPALVGCPKAAQLLLADGDRLSLTRAVLEEGLEGRFGAVDEILLERIYRAPPDVLETLVGLGEERQDLEPAISRVLDPLHRLLWENLRHLETLRGIETEPLQAGELADAENRGIPGTPTEPTLPPMDRNRAEPRPADGDGGSLGL